MCYTKICSLSKESSFPTDHDDGYGVRAPRQADMLTTDPALTPDTAAMPSTTPTPPNDNSSSRKLIGALVGSLTGMFVIVIVLAAVTVGSVVWGWKMSSRRREQMDLVLRTKHDIFEGVPNVSRGRSVSGGSSEDPQHNVLDSASPAAAERGSGLFELTPVATGTAGAVADKPAN